ncbi:MAG: hypothetical protein KBT61_05535 [Paraperlucidibaca sp.]|nr:hypothetical protein [Paraperlucidibaca sp.]MBQ0722950.1 hypothetical protein [Paraperlucidibaca sp.]MBQ0842410.1 hypothetical protein [Paraperlucidibaca sp.]
MSVILDAASAGLSQLDIADGVIISSVAGIIFWVLFKLNRSKHSAQKVAMPQQGIPSDQASGIRPSTLTPPASAAVPLKDQQNPKYIQQIEECLAGIPSQMSSQANQLLSSPLLTLIDKARAKFEQYTTKGSFANSEELNDYVEEILEYDLQGVRSSLVKASEKIGERFVEDYKETLTQVFAVMPEPLQSLKQKFTLTTDQASEQRLRISGYCRSSFSEVAGTLERLHSGQSIIKAAYPKFQQQVASKMDWDVAFKSAASSAVIIVNPLVGVPMLLASAYGGYKNFNAKNQSTDTYLMHVRSFYEQFIALENDIQTAGSEVTKYVHGKATESYVGAFSYVCKAIDDSAGSLKDVVPVFTSYSIK